MCNSQPKIYKSVKSFTHCNGRIIFFNFLPGTRGPLHSGGPWTLPTVPTPLLRHCTQGVCVGGRQLTATAQRRHAPVVCVAAETPFDTPRPPCAVGFPRYTTAAFRHCTAKAALRVLRDVLLVLFIPATICRRAISYGRASVCDSEPKKRAWRHGRAWKMKIRAWKNQYPCFNFYKHIYALLHKYPV